MPEPDEPTSPHRWWDGCDLVLNASILFPEVPFPIRPEVVRVHGFDRMESWWPFAGWVATPAERAAFLEGLGREGVGLLALNAPSGDMAAGDRGIAMDASSAADFRRGIVDTVSILVEAGGDRCNVLVGNESHGGLDADGHGVTLLIEVLNGTDNPGYLVRSLGAGLRWLERIHAAGGESARLLFDVYHLAMIGENPTAAARRAAGVIGHVQVADSPGRGAPGTGSIDIASAIDAVRAAGYDGPVALEYRHQGPGAFDWMR